MIETIDSRELFTLDCPGALLQGTYHKPKDIAGSQTDAGNRIGLLFVNSLFLPRTATGDSAVYWAESFAALGYPSFRVDLPGLGDTYAPLNTALSDFINAGGYESIATAAVKEVVERFRLAGVVIVGHCAGSISALYAAAGSKECQGVVLMDPFFHLPQKMKESKAWKGLVRWAARSSFGGALSSFYDLLKKIRLAVRGSRPPENANFALLRRWQTVATRGTPILLLKAPSRKATGTQPRVGEFDYLKYCLELAGSKSKVVVQLIESTDHSFANRAGRKAVRQHMERWLNTCVPLSKCEDPVPRVLDSERRNNSVEIENHASCL